jgi:predicted N-formylglutamate amidohydrolase
MSGTGGRSRGILLGPEDPSPVKIENRYGSGWFLFTGDHAGNRVPRRLADLGLPRSELARHIGIDSGVAQLGRMLSRRLDCPFIAQRYSRLVIDCNRRPGHPASIAPVSDEVAVPGNQALGAEAREARRTEVFAPYHRAIGEVLAQRRSRGLPTVFVALHSFTPVLAGKQRPWDIGVMHGGGDTRFALSLLALLRAESRWRIGENQPYALDATDFSVPHHAYDAGLPYVEIEVRADRLATPAGRTKVAGLLAQALAEAAPSLE